MRLWKCQYEEHFGTNLYQVITEDEMWTDHGEPIASEMDNLDRETFFDQIELPLVQHLMSWTAEPIDSMKAINGYTAERASLNHRKKQLEARLHELEIENAWDWFDAYGLKCIREVQRSITELLGFDGPQWEQQFFNAYLDTDRTAQRDFVQRIVSHY